MNKNKVALGVLFTALLAGFLYNQVPLSDQVKQGINSDLTEEISKSASVSTTENNTIENSTIESNQLAVSQSKYVEPIADIIQSKPLESDQNKVKITTQSHEKPADHRSAAQPKAHGHENQRRNPEDNSLIPPGEPKKPISDSAGKS
jgi:hypothetical protein